MTLSISRLQIDAGDVNYYTPAIRQMIEDLRSRIVTSASTSTVEITLDLEYRFRGDFYKLLQQMKYPQDMFWIIMRINGLHSPIDYDGNLGTLLVPSRHTLDTLVQKYMTQYTLG
jgi:hypothetical protein